MNGPVGGAGPAVVALSPLIDVAGFVVYPDVLFTGFVTGLTYALLGAGLVLVHRASRVINIAHGEVGVFGALLTALLVLNTGAPFLVALPLAVLAGAAVGALVEIIVVRRLFRTPRVVLLVATIGVSQVMLLCSLALPEVDGNAYPTISDWRGTVGGVEVRAADLTVLVVVPVVVITLGLWLERTRIGSAVRAAADNADAARLAGVPVAWMSTLVWALAGGLAVLAVTLNGPVTGQSVALSTAGFGPAMLLRALVAGLIGRFVSLPVTLAGGVALGVVDALVIANHPTSGGLTDLVLLATVLLVLLLQLAVGAGGRLAGADDGTFTLTPRIAAMPGWTAAVPWLRALRPAVVGVAIVVAAGLPLVVTGSAPLFRLTLILCFGLVGLSVTVVLGWSGQLSLGQFAFAGVGAALTAILTTNQGWPLLPAVAVATVAGAAAAVVVGTQALAFRGLTLAVATLAFGVATQTWLFDQPWATTESSASAVDLGGFFGDSPRAYYLLCLAVLVAAAAAVAALRRGRLGRALLAVRDNERAAAAAGVSPTRTKLTAFALSGALAAAGGALYGGLLVRFTDVAFSPEQSLAAVAMTVVGGLGTVSGAIVGPAWVIGVPLLFGDSQAARLAASGIGLLVLLLYLPGGVAGLAAGVRDALVRLAASGGHGPPPPARPRPAPPASPAG
ncbi:ABC transporter permease [Frankia sp. Cpl3]|nr:ABC transporter permease [Frankia sp. Cpl3]